MTRATARSSPKSSRELPPPPSLAGTGAPVGPGDAPPGDPGTLLATAVGTSPGGALAPDVLAGVDEATAFGEAPADGAPLGAGLAVAPGTAVVTAVACAVAAVVGAGVGFFDGAGVGFFVGAGVGAVVGAAVGAGVGAFVGAGVGAFVGVAVGVTVGVTVGVGVAWLATLKVTQGPMTGA